MELQGRTLHLRMRGEDVALLQRELRQMGFTMDDQEGYFGSMTRLTVHEFQNRHELEPTGEVDERTAARINRMVEGERPQPQRRFVVNGQVVHSDGKKSLHENGLHYLVKMSFLD